MNLMLTAPCSHSMKTSHGQTKTLSDFFSQSTKLFMDALDKAAVRIPASSSSLTLLCNRHVSTDYGRIQISPHLRPSRSSHQLPVRATSIFACCLRIHSSPD